VLCRWCVCQSSREGDGEAALPLVALPRSGEPELHNAVLLWLSKELESLECDDRVID